MTWSDKARQAAAIQRRKGAKLAKKKTPLQQARDIRVNHKSASSRPTFGTGGKKYPSSAIGSQGTPVKSPAKPLTSKPEHKPPASGAVSRNKGGKVGDSRMNPLAQARNYKSQAKSPRTPVLGTKKKYPSSKRGR